LDMPLSRKSWIDAEVSDDKTIPKVLFSLYCSSDLGLHVFQG